MVQPRKIAFAEMISTSAGGEPDDSQELGGTPDLSEFSRVTQILTAHSQADTIETFV